MDEIIAMQPTLVCCFSTNQGGMELMSFDLTKLLAPLGEVHLVCRAESFIHNEAVNYGIKSVIGIPFKGNFSFKLIREFNKILEDKKIKNVIFLGASELRSLYFSCRNKDVNFINFHGTTKTHSKKDFLHKMIYKIVSTHVTVSDHIQANVKKILPLFNHTQVKTIYTPKEIGQPPSPKPAGRYNCLLVGRIVYGKGHFDAIDACEFALKAGLDVELTFAGNAENKEIYNSLNNKLATSTMKDRCHFVGHQKDLSSLYQKAHFLLFPSLGEGLPAVLLEAFQYGVLPITYNNTVFPEFLRLGFQFPQAQNKSVDELSTLFVDAIKKYPNLKPQIEKNYELSKNLFSTKRIQQEYLSIMK
jgi:glycosyltransferase involved in cell wall biosynthesis